MTTAPDPVPLGVDEAEGRDGEGEGGLRSAEVVYQHPPTTL